MQNTLSPGGVRSSPVGYEILNVADRDERELCSSVAIETQTPRPVG